MTKSELIEALQEIKGNPEVVFNFVDDDKDIDVDCAVDFVYLEDGEIHLSDSEEEDEDDDGEEAEVIDVDFKKAV